VAIRYRDFRPTDPDAATDLAPIVFVPGMTDVAADYDGIAESTGRRTVVVETRGHGHSDAPADGYRLEDHVGDIDAVVDAVVGPDGPIHVMTFSRGSGYAYGWVEQHRERVRSLSIGDYPGREIKVPVEVAEGLMRGRWRGTPVTERLRHHAALAKFRESRDRPFWDLIAGLGVPVLVVRSTAPAPLNDDDWKRYHELDAPIDLVEFTESPHDIFRPDRTRYPRLVGALADRGDELAGAAARVSP